MQEIYSADAGQRQALTRPQPTLPLFNPRPLVSPPLSLFVPGPLTSLTALNPRGGGAEADDQAKPANGAASAPDPGSILQAKHRRRWTASDLLAAAGLRSSGKSLNYNSQTALRDRGARKRRMSVPGKPPANRVGTSSHTLHAHPPPHTPPQPHGGPLSDVCGKLSRFLLTPSNFCRKCLASCKPKLHSPEFLALSASTAEVRLVFHGNLGEKYEKLAILAPAGHPKGHFYVLCCN